MDRVYIVDTDTELYNALLDCADEVIQISPSGISTLDGFVLINADVCGDRYVRSTQGVGIALFSGDLTRVCEDLLDEAEHVFGSVNAVRTFLLGNGIWNSEYFRRAQNNAEFYLRYIGMSERLDGFLYMSFIVSYLTFAGSASLKYEVYPVMEKLFNKSVQCMERAMRYAVEVTWNRGDIFAQEHLFGYSVSPERGKPVALELAAMLSERIRDEMLYDRA